MHRSPSRASVRGGVLLCAGAAAVATGLLPALPRVSLPSSGFVASAQQAGGLLGSPFGGSSSGGGLPGGGSGLSGGGTRLSQGGQGGFSPGGGGRFGGGGGSGVFGLLPGQTYQVAALCTDLLSDPPTAGSRFTDAKGGHVQLASGGMVTLAAALQEGTLTMRGRDNSFDPIRRDGSLALDLYLVNTSGGPVRVSLPAGATFTPDGQPEQTLPPGATRLPEEAEKLGITALNTLQFAVWAARGSTAEQVEQANMFRLPDAERERVQDLLDACDIRREFERERGAAEKRYTEASQKLGPDAEDVAATGYLDSGVKAEVNGKRGADDAGVVVIHPLKGGGEFRYRARFQDRKDGRTVVTLFNLEDGRPVHANRGRVVVSRA